MASVVVSRPQTHGRKTAKQLSLGTVSSLALVAVLADAGYAQNVASSPNVEEIVVTGSRVIRDGFQAPTPLTVIDTAAIEKFATPNVADFVNTLPVFSGSQTPSATQNTSSGTAGINALNLRGLGTQRTLVLLDGQRSVGSVLTGVVDVNIFPQQLISRVDVVTGGASAAYGSDAVAGVANFILDKEFTGVKGEVSGGVTTYGDNASWKVALSAGTPFANGRGHFLISGDANWKEGIEQSKRPWNMEGWGTIVNPNYTATNGQPQRLVLPRVGLQQATFGGIITAGPLKGIDFGPGGAPRQFNYGNFVSNPWMQDGDWEATYVRHLQGASLDSRESRQNAFTRVSYDLADNVNIYAQFSWAQSASRSQCCPHTFTGNITVTPDNAYLPAEVRLRAQGMTSFAFGKTFLEMGPVVNLFDRRVNRNVIGAEGTFDAMGSDWNWDFYFQNGVSRQSAVIPRTINNANFARARDAIFHPTTGIIVCRVNGDAVATNDDPSCVPFNMFGVEAASEAALNYSMGSPWRSEKFTQNVVAASMSGEPLSLWAGPVSLAMGAEHRSEKVSGVADALSQTAGWFIGNFRATFGEYSVTEGFVETVVPLASGESWAKSLDLNAAVRATDYSTSGYVTTWKVGATWAPVDDIRLRATRSRDIRAPNLQELYQAGGAATNSVVDPFNNFQSVTYVLFTTGNLSLRPEKADTLGLGVVLQPTFLPGFNASIDYWDINIKDALGSVGAQTIVDLCYQGNQDFCQAITRTGPIISQIRNSPFNLVTINTRGLDMEASYRAQVSDWVDSWTGDLTIRALATHYLKDYSNNGVNVPVDRVGQNLPHWRWTAGVTYNLDPLSLGLTARGISAGKRDVTNVECQTGCPAATPTNITINDNRTPSAVYLDASVSYTFMGGDDEGPEAEAFFNVKNLMNRDPETSAPGPGGSAWGVYAASSNLYDLQGRTFRAGIRFRN